MTAYVTSYRFIGADLIEGMDRSVISYLTVNHCCTGAGHLLQVISGTLRIVWRVEVGSRCLTLKHGCILSFCRPKALGDCAGCAPPLGINNLLRCACCPGTICLLSASFLITHFSLAVAGLRAPLSRFLEGALYKYPERMNEQNFHFTK